MTAKEWLGVIQQAADYNPKMTPLIEKYGEMLLLEAQLQPVADELIIENLLNNKAIETPYIIIGAKSFTRKELADEIRNKTKVGKDVVNNIISLLLEKFPQKPKVAHPVPSDAEAYNNGYDYGLNGVRNDNCHYTNFSTKEKTTAWERGRDAGEADGQAALQYKPVPDEWKENIKERIKEVEKYKEEAMSGYSENIGSNEIETMSAALNMAYGMEIVFLNKLLKSQPVDNGEPVEDKK